MKIKDSHSFNPLGEQEKMLEILRCVVDGKTATYVSGPITTGEIFLDWLVSNRNIIDLNALEYGVALREHVIAKNEKNIIEVARKLRDQRHTAVIEPASLYIQEWDQETYLRFWLDIIRNFVAEVVLVDGWQYSVGCVAEFSFATRMGIKIYSQYGELMDGETGKNLIHEASLTIEQRSKDSPILLSKFKKLLHRELLK